MKTLLHFMFIGSLVVLVIMLTNVITARMAVLEPAMLDTGFSVISLDDSRYFLQILDEAVKIELIDHTLYVQWRGRQLKFSYQFVENIINKVLQ